jgi:hypothetical protein
MVIPEHPYAVIVIDISRGSDLTVPGEICLPAAVKPHARVRAGIRNVGLAIAVVAVMIALGTRMSAVPVSVPMLPGRPAALGMMQAVPPAPLHTQELRVVDSLSAVTPDSMFASPAGLSRVVLVRAEDRTSLALEMTAEPAKAVLRSLSPTALELEVGPVSGAIRAGAFVASDMPLIKQITVREASAAHHSYVRTRLMLNAAGRGDVRIVGRVVYVDLAPLD